MIQNAADASATRVTIKFETLPSTTVPLPPDPDQSTLLRHVIANHTLKRLLISNNGHPFSERDWSRLKRIADGNPDETKIGAFGVGFYSVFDDCEEPFVSSGNQAMAFYWKGNALFTRRLQLNDSDANPETTFVLDYRNNTSPVPALMQLAQFLATSLTFVGLEEIHLWLDEWHLLQLTKKPAPREAISVPADIETKTAENLMKIVGVTREVTQVDAKWMRVIEWSPQTATSRLEGIKDTTISLRSWFSKLTNSSSQTSTEKKKKSENSGNGDEEDLTKINTSSVFLHITTAAIQASISPSLSSELERATRKPPPKRTSIAVLTPSYAADAASEKSEVLSSVLPSKSGRVFIGFPTHQTTGLNAHISAPSVIPTVERENIDLNTRYISRWNLEMLRAAGIVCRIAWAVDMAAIQSNVVRKAGSRNAQNIRSDHIAGVIPEAVDTANQFVFRESTPSSLLGQTIENSFWMCNKNASIEVLSTRGVLPSHRVRVAPKELSFMDNIPSLPEEFVSNAPEFVRKLTDFGLVTNVTVTDIKDELEKSPLTSKQLAEFLAWAGKRAANGELDASTLQAMLDVAVANEEESGADSGRLLVLSEIKNYLIPTRIPVNLPVPPSVMPFKYTKAMTNRELEALGWTELQIVPWMQWLVNNASNRNVLSSDKDITKDPAFSAQILPVLSKQWDTLSAPSKQVLVDLLRSKTVIPTKGGMKRPMEAYFPSVRLFDDLPVVTGLTGVKEKFLAALGVRKTVELGVIFERLLADNNASEGQKGPKWSHVDLIIYLASVQDDIPASDISRLKETKICTAEDCESETARKRRYKISDLFEPKDSLRKLELPIIEWRGKYQPHSKEARFLSKLGLRAYPSAAEVIGIIAKAAAEGNESLFVKSMAYFTTEYHNNGYASFDASQVTTPFLPVEGSKKLSTPRICFTNEGAALFNFDILRRDLHPHATKLGVREHPPIGECVKFVLQNPPMTSREARNVFGYMAGRIAEISPADKDRLGQAPIIPITKAGADLEKRQSTRLIEPRQCYLGDSEDFRDIFDFVDFGQNANLFLLSVGSKHEPSKVEVAQMLVKEPARISSSFQNPDKYLNLLRSLAESLPQLRRNKELFQAMTRSPFLLASRELPAHARIDTKSRRNEHDEDDDAFEDDDQGIKEYQLVSAKNAVVVDDYQSFTLFKEHILAAPQEEILEKFYAALGTPFLSSLVEERAHWGPEAADQRPMAKLQRLINERTRLFLHDQSADSIKHDARWLEKHLKITIVQSISLRRSLKNSRITHSQKRNAITTKSGSDWVLWISPGKFDLYEISQALVHLLLHRPKLHSILTLEMILKTDLYELRARGYNVERILRQRAAEARMAENQRQKQLEDERRRLQEREAEWQKSQRVSSDVESSPQMSIPGQFPSGSPSRDQSQEQQVSRPDDLLHDFQPRNLFSSLSKRLGFDDGRHSKNPFQSILPNRSSQEVSNADSGAPPPYSATDPQQQKPTGSQAVTSPYRLQDNLLSAIQACRPHGASGVYTRPAINQVSETKSYCDEHPSHDLEFVATLPSGIHFLMTKSISNRSAVLAEHSAGIDAFASILAECAHVFSLRVDSITIFYGPQDKAIAFNRAGSLFCNYHYFQQLHESPLRQDPKAGRADALVYWWVILCHELAHNLVSEHSSAHSFYT